MTMSFLDHAMCVEYRETIAGTNAGWVWNGLSWFSWGVNGDGDGDGVSEEPGQSQRRI